MIDHANKQYLEPNGFFQCIVGIIAGYGILWSLWEISFSIGYFIG